MSAPWITYRPELKVLDCTIRDGGLINDHMFEDGLVQAVYETCIEAGIDYMEVGYKASKKLFAPSKFGVWKFCDEDDVRRIVGDNETSLKLAAMADAEKTDYHTDILPKEQSVLDVIRVATYVHQIPVAADMIHDAHEKGYEVTCNLMAVSIVQEAELAQALEVLVETSWSRSIVRPWRAPARKSAFMPTTTNSSPLPIPLRPLFMEPTASTQRWRVSVGGRGIAPWSC
jgi:4-hydroxy 2-oxovalerate aldolase